MSQNPQTRKHIGPEEFCSTNEFCTTCPARNSCVTRKGFYSQTRTAHTQCFSSIQFFLESLGSPQHYIDAQVQRMETSIQSRSAEEFRLCNLAEECLDQYDCNSCPNCATCTFRGLLLKAGEVNILHGSIAENTSIEPIVNTQLISAIQCNSDICNAINKRAWQARCKANLFSPVSGVSYNLRRMQILDNLIKEIRSAVDIHGDA